MPPARPLPQVSDLKAAYYRLGSVRKVSRHFRVTDWRVAQALYEAGILKKPLAERQLAATREHKCESCRFARADRCPYMAADSGKLEAVLIHLGARYERREHGFFVAECPRWEEGDVAG